MCAGCDVQLFFVSHTVLFLARIGAYLFPELRCMPVLALMLRCYCEALERVSVRGSCCFVVGGPGFVIVCAFYVSRFLLFVAACLSYTESFPLNGLPLPC